MPSRGSRPRPDIRWLQTTGPLWGLRFSSASSSAKISGRPPGPSTPAPRSWCSPRVSRCSARWSPSSCVSGRRPPWSGGSPWAPGHIAEVPTARGSSCGPPACQRRPRRHRRRAWSCRQRRVPCCRRSRWCSLVAIDCRRTLLLCQARCYHCRRHLHPEIFQMVLTHGRWSRRPPRRSGTSRRHYARPSSSPTARRTWPSPATSWTRPPPVRAARSSTSSGL
mmetsp:Transcript_29537/g.92145  ORF Transcript_29537/g.92145 Transcript_29537/m.92145 type:complete len:222 (-) Transcript_29537:451-1116(-)